MARPLARSELGVLHPLGKGGTAKVYHVPDLQLPTATHQRWVYKEYKPQFRPAVFGMEQLVRLPEGLAPDQRTQFERCLMWPTAVVTDDKSAAEGAAGVILPLIPDDYFLKLHLSAGTKSKPAEGQFLFQDREYCTRVGIRFPEPDERLAILHRLCYAMGLLHRAEVVFGDMSARNFLYRLHPRPGVVLVDCDATRLKSTSAATGLQPHSPDWEPPEATEATRRKDKNAWTIQNVATDRYKLGLAVLRVMTPGVNSTNRDPRAAKTRLPQPLYGLLERSLSPDAAARPSAKEWYSSMKGTAP